MQDNPPLPDKITATCPSCGKTYTIDAVYAGRTAKCSKCGTTFRLEAPATAAATTQEPAATPAAPSAEAAPAPSAEAAAAPQAQAAAAPQTEAAPMPPQAPAPPAGPLCAICQSPLDGGEETVDCPDCRTRYHRPCWDYNQGCGMYGCPKAPPTQRLETLEIPVSYWGKEEKNCPRCNRVILAAAVRCRYCGATFASQQPETAGDFQQRVTQEQKVPQVRRWAVWMLVLSILPCAAPVMAVVGPLWYLRNRRAIADLPGLHATLCKIAVAVALGQTALMVVVALLYSAFRS